MINNHGYYQVVQTKVQKKSGKNYSCFNPQQAYILYQKQKSSPKQMSGVIAVLVLRINFLLSPIVVLRLDFFAKNPTLQQNVEC